MITVENFVGALLEELEKARVLSDQASLRIAHLYLENEFLRGFPIPRMQVSDIELELAFAVAKPLGRQLGQQEVRRHLAYRVREFVAGLPEHSGFGGYFGEDAELRRRWIEGLDALVERLLQILERVADEHKGVLESITLVVHTYFHEMAPVRLQPGVTAFLREPLEKRTGKRDQTVPTRGGYIEEQISICLREQEKPETTEQSPQLNLLLGAIELEGVRPESLSTLKLKVSPADRHWVISERDGKKIATLGR